MHLKWTHGLCFGSRIMFGQWWTLSFLFTVTYLLATPFLFIPTNATNTSRVANVAFHCRGSFRRCGLLRFLSHEAFHIALDFARTTAWQENIAEWSAHSISARGFTLRWQNARSINNRSCDVTEHWVTCFVFVFLSSLWGRKDFTGSH